MMGVTADCTGMQHSGIGGGGFMLVGDSNGGYESIGMAIGYGFEDLLIVERLPRNCPSRCL